MISFTGALGIIILYSISGTLITDIENETLGALLDSFGIRTFFIETKYFTPAEKNTLAPTFSGLVLWNRLTWIAVGAVVLGLSFFGFSFKTRNKKAKSKSSKKAGRSITVAEHLPNVGRAFHWQAHMQQFISFFSITFRSILKSQTFRILFLFCLILYIVDLAQGFEYYGIQSYPVTYKMTDSLEGASTLFIIIILVFFSGEVIWRDRMNHMNEVIDATPHPSFTSLLGRVFALISVAVFMHLFMIVLGIGYQLIKGYTAIEIDVYLGSLVFDQLPIYIIWSMVLVFVQVLINQRYLGYFASILFIFLIDILWSILDIDTNMVTIGSRPSLFYSDMNGFGDGFYGAMWFNLYWILFGVITLELASLIWTRGKVARIKERFAIAGQQLRTRRGIPFYLSLCAWILVAGFVYYNTQILNDYMTSDEQEELLVRYETEFKKYENQPMPKISSVNYTIDVFPEERAIYVIAEMGLINDSDKPIDEIHFTLDEDWTQEFEIPGATVTFDDEGGLYRIYSLNEVIQPGENMDITIKTSYVSEGFENEVSNQNILSNGTFFNNTQILPTIGYNDQYELSDKNERKSYGLAKKARVPKLQENCTDACMINYLTNGKADWVEVETVISTTENQLAIAPGSLIKEWNEDGRNYYHYKVDHPSQNFYSFMSAEFEVAKRDWNGVSIEVYYDEKQPSERRNDAGCCSALS